MEETRAERHRRIFEIVNANAKARLSAVRPDDQPNIEMSGERETLRIRENGLSPKLEGVFKVVEEEESSSASLEIHQDGFRCIITGSRSMDILNSNVKYAFIQSCKKENNILLHFRLKSSLVFNDSWVSDIQFFTKFGQLSRLGPIRSENIDDLNEAINSFCENISRLSNNEITFSKPEAEYLVRYLFGSVSIKLYPTESCLVHLTSEPVLIIPLPEVEFIRFEQSQEGRRYKHFDMVAVYKDYSIEPTSIYAVSEIYMEKMKLWFESRGILYSEGDQQVNWPVVLRTIMQDAEGFFNDGGWNLFNEILRPDSSDEDVEESDAE